MTLPSGSHSPAGRNQRNEDHARYEYLHFRCALSTGKSGFRVAKSTHPTLEPVVCDYVIDELHRKFHEKFPNRITELDAFLYIVQGNMEVVPTPEEENPSEAKIRDVKDRPILRAALNTHADLFLTGDKDFLESSVVDPRIISVADFLDNMD